ncbi:MAG: dihydropteroate synthase [Brumimicrobium sp.]|nr:dihydropteroate synthase [Brumimicrobium sp.]
MDGKDNKIEDNNTIKCGDKLIDLAELKIMGIVNVTPDSFFKGSRISNKDALLKRVEQMIAEGADIIDIGGNSTRPGAEHVSLEEELDRVVPAIESVSENFGNTLISVDTFRSVVARESVHAGAHIINDVYAGSFDHKMFQTVADLQVPYVLMHSRGNSKTMNDLSEYLDVVSEVIGELKEKIIRLRNLGVKKIIIDPGFGFAKNQDQNYTLLRNLSAFKDLNYPVLVGVSRKRMIWKKLGITPSEALNGTTVLNTLAFLNGANILRVHDVKEAVEIRKLLNF